jgi:hypothetical protein
MSDITWDHIDFGSYHPPRVEEDGNVPEVSPEVTNIEIQVVAREHFPEGPVAAIEPQKAWVAYRKSVAAEKAALPFDKQFFFKSQRPMPQVANRWDAFVKDWSTVVSIHGFWGTVILPISILRRDQPDAAAPAGGDARFMARPAATGGQWADARPLRAKKGQIAAFGRKRPSGAF